MPTRRHETEYAATVEAKRLANLNPGEDFFVLVAAKHVIRREPVEVTDLGIPF
jgi:hypothetical protein